MPKVVDREAKRNQIMDAALDLFLEKGYKTVTTRELAAHAGVSKGVLYDYFKNKEDLFYMTIRENMQKKIVYQMAALSENYTPREKFTALKELVIDNLDEKEKRFKLMFDFYVNCPDQEFKEEVIGELYAYSRKYLATLISEAFPDTCGIKEDAEMYSSMLMAFLDGLLLQYCAADSPEVVRKTFDKIWEVMTVQLESCIRTETA